MKKFWAALLAVVLAASLGSVAFADGPLPSVETLLYDGTLDYHSGNRQFDAVEGLLVYEYPSGPDKPYGIEGFTYDAATKTWKLDVVVKGPGVSFDVDMVSVENENDKEKNSITVQPTTKKELHEIIFTEGSTDHYKGKRDGAEINVYSWYWSVRLDNDANTGTAKIEFTIEQEGYAPATRYLEINMRVGNVDEIGKSGRSNLWRRVAAEQASLFRAAKADVLAAEEGGVVKVDVKNFQGIPHSFVDAVAGKNLTLKLTYKVDGKGETAEIDCSKVEKTAPDRIYFPVAEFVALYQ